MRVNLLGMVMYTCRGELEDWGLIYNKVFSVGSVATGANFAQFAFYYLLKKEVPQAHEKLCSVVRSPGPR